VDKPNRDRRRFNVAVIVGIMAIAFLVALVIIWWAPISFPWNVLASWVTAVLIGLWGSRLLVRVNGVGKHRE
jgi:hypothetical protein